MTPVETHLAFDEQCRNCDTVVESVKLDFVIQAITELRIFMMNSDVINYTLIFSTHFCASLKQSWRKCSHVHMKAVDSCLYCKVTVVSAHSSLLPLKMPASLSKVAESDVLA